MLKLFGGWSIPPVPFPPDCDPPSPIRQFLALFLGILLLAECLTFLLPEPWRYTIFCAVFERVWPFSVVDRWIRTNLK